MDWKPACSATSHLATLIGLSFSSGEDSKLNWLTKQARDKPSEEWVQANKTVDPEQKENSSPGNRFQI